MVGQSQTRVCGQTLHNAKTGRTCQSPPFLAATSPDPPPPPCLLDTPSDLELAFDPVQPSQAPREEEGEFPPSSPLDPSPYHGFGQPFLFSSETKKAFFLIQRALGHCHASRSRRQAPLQAPGRCTRSPNRCLALQPPPRARPQPAAAHGHVRALSAPPSQCPLPQHGSKTPIPCPLPQAFPAPSMSPKSPIAFVCSCRSRRCTRGRCAWRLGRPPAPAPSPGTSFPASATRRRGKNFGRAHRPSPHESQAPPPQASPPRPAPH